MAVETIEGFVREQPETTFTPSGKAISKFRLYNKQTDEPFSDRRIITWEKLAEKCSEILIPDEKIYAKGYWKERSWENHDGKPITIKEFTANAVWVNDKERIVSIIDLFSDPSDYPPNQQSVLKPIERKNDQSSF